MLFRLIQMTSLPHLSWCVSYERGNEQEGKEKGTGVQGGGVPSIKGPAQKVACPFCLPVEQGSCGKNPHLHRHVRSSQIWSLLGQFPEAVRDAWLVALVSLSQILRIMPQSYHVAKMWKSLLFFGPRIMPENAMLTHLLNSSIRITYLHEQSLSVSVNWCIHAPISANWT